MSPFSLHTSFTSPIINTPPRLHDPFEGSYYNEEQSVKPIPDRGHGKNHKRMDPFEVRIRFTQHLQHLNASITAANKAAQYALKYRDMDEDLHSCIIEQLERVSLFVPDFLHSEK